MANSSRGSSVRDQQHHRHHHRGGGGGGGGGGGHHQHSYHHHYNDYRKRPDPDSCLYKLKEFGRKLTAFLFGHVGICGLVVGYIIMGAFAFQAIESEGTKKKYEDVVRLREQTITNLWNITNELNVLYPSEWNESVALQVLQFQRKIVQFVLEGYDGKHYQINRTQLQILQQFGEFDGDQSVNPSVVTSTADPNGGSGGTFSSATGNPGAWSFSASFLYCLTVITTIGYGNIAPRTTMGKLVTIAYAMVGMPLFLLYVSNMGDFLATCFRWGYVNVCRCNCGRTNNSRSHHHQVQQHHQHQLQQNQKSVRRQGGKSLQHQDDTLHHRQMGARSEYELADLTSNHLAPTAADIEMMSAAASNVIDYQTATVPLTISVSVLVSYVCGGAYLFKQWESEWGFLDGSYFCFISLSTTGFGDLVPGDSLIGGSGSSGVELSLIFCSMYLIIGMALIAMCFNLMQEEVIAKVRKCGVILGCCKPDD